MSQSPLQVWMPRHLGDAMLALPALRLISAHVPTVVLADGVVAQTLGGEPDLRVGPRESLGPGPVVLFARSFRAAWRARVAGANPRIGELGDARSLLLTHVVPPPTEPLPGPADGRALPALLVHEHQADAYWRVARAALAALGVDLDGAAVGGPGDSALALTALERQVGAAMASEHGEPRVVLHPCVAGAAMKRWPRERWVALARQLPRCVVTGGPSSADDGLVTSIATEAGVPALAGATALPVRRWAALAVHAGTVVTVDTGIGHVARAVGARTVSLFGASDPRRHGPRGPGELALLHGGASLTCSPCYADRCTEEPVAACMRGIEVGRVSALARRQ